MPARWNAWHGWRASRAIAPPPGRGSPRAWRLFRELGDATVSPNALNTLADVAIMDEDPARAEALLAESRAIAQRARVSLICLALDAASAWACRTAARRIRPCGAAPSGEPGLFRQPCDYSIGPLAAYHGLGAAALGQEAGRGRALVCARAGAQSDESDQASMAWCLAGLGSAAALDEAARARRTAVGRRRTAATGDWLPFGARRARDLRAGDRCGARPARRDLCGGLGGRAGADAGAGDRLCIRRSC